MKATPLVIEDGKYVECEASEATHVRLHTPGPFPFRWLPVITSGPRRGTPCWTWNGSTSAPTLRPSVLTRDDGTICHSWVTDGRIQYLADCTHEFAGQTMDLL